MPQAARLSREFYERDTVLVARALLGQRLVRIVDGLRLSGRICETEAYGGPDDPSSHAYRRTPRSEIMFGAPGFAYVYLIYGTHHCINAVSEPPGSPGAVLIRALILDENLAEVRRRRGLPAAGSHLRGVADGPGKLCQALDITLAENGADLTAGETLFIEQDEPVSEEWVRVTPRIGVRGDEEARTRLWRYLWLAPARQQSPQHR
jgi:DNA-3-methyladenine glycosylase